MNNIAQPFEVLQQEGIILRAASLCIPIDSNEYMIESKDDNLSVGFISLKKPLKIDIRELDNDDLPSNLIIDSSILYLSKNISAKFYDSYIQLFFNWNTPIYLEPKKYCLSVFTNSTELTLLTAEKRNLDINDKAISVPSNIGNICIYSSFGWNKDLYKSTYLMFSLYRAQFNKSSSDDYIIQKKSFKVKLDSNAVIVEKNSNEVKILIDNHGLLSQLPNKSYRSKIRLSGFTKPIGGISETILNGVHNVVRENSNFIVIKVIEKASFSSRSDESRAYITLNRIVDKIHAICDYKEFPRTNIQSSITAYKGYTLNNKTYFNQYEKTTESIPLNREHHFEEYPLYGLSSLNKSDGSIDLKLTLSTDSEFVAPIIDLNKTNLILKSNSINNPAPIHKLKLKNTALAGTDTLVLQEINTQIDTDYFVIGDAFDQNTKITNIQESRILKLNKSILEDIPEGTIIRAFANISGYSYEENYRDETLNNSSSLSKYITKVFTVETPRLLAIVDTKINRPSESDVEVYFRTLNSTNIEESIFDQKWKQMTISKGNIVPFSNNKNEFKQVTFSGRDVNKYNMIQFKFVFKTKVSTKIPTIKDINLLFR